MNSEAAYLFRHVLLREAAYQLQLPGDRARLHGRAFRILERHCGGRPQSAPVPGRREPDGIEAHESDSFAIELAVHAGESGDAGLRTARVLYLARAARLAELQYRFADASHAWEGYAAAAGEAGVSGWALHAGARAAQQAWQLERAADLGERACAALEQLGDDRARGIAMGFLAGLDLDRRRLDSAERRYLAALDLQRSIGNRESEGALLGNLALLLKDRGRLAEAEELLSRALAISREFGNRHAQAVGLGNLGNLLFLMGRSAEAEEAQAAALRLHREEGDRKGEAHALGNLARLSHSPGRPREAEAMFRKALAIASEIGDRRFEGLTLGNLAGLFFEEERMEDAEAAWERGLAINREIGNRRSEGVQLGDLANLYRRTGRPELAETACRQAVEIHRQMANPRFQALVLGTLADLARDRGDGGEARRLFAEGLALALPSGDAFVVASLRSRVAQLDLEEDRLDEAELGLRDALAAFRAIRHHRRESVVLADLERCAVKRRRQGTIPADP